MFSKVKKKKNYSKNMFALPINCITLSNIISQLITGQNCGKLPPHNDSLDQKSNCYSPSEIAKKFHLKFLSQIENGIFSYKSSENPQKNNNNVNSVSDINEEKFIEEFLDENLTNENDLKSKLKKITLMKGAIKFELSKLPFYSPKTNNLKKEYMKILNNKFDFKSFLLDYSNNSLLNEGKDSTLKPQIALLSTLIRRFIPSLNNEFLESISAQLINFIISFSTEEGKNYILETKNSLSCMNEDIFFHINTVFNNQKIVKALSEIFYTMLRSEDSYSSVGKKILELRNILIIDFFLKFINIDEKNPLILLMLGKFSDLNDLETAKLKEFFKKMDEIMKVDEIMKIKENMDMMKLSGETGDFLEYLLSPCFEFILKNVFSNDPLQLTFEPLRKNHIIEAQDKIISILKDTSKENENIFDKIYFILKAEESPCMKSYLLFFKSSFSKIAIEFISILNISQDLKTKAYSEINELPNEPLYKIFFIFSHILKLFLGGDNLNDWKKISEIHKKFLGISVNKANCIEFDKDNFLEFFLKNSDYNDDSFFSGLLSSIFKDFFKWSDEEKEKFSAEVNKFFKILNEKFLNSEKNLNFFELILYYFPNKGDYNSMNAIEESLKSLYYTISRPNDTFGGKTGNELLPHYKSYLDKSVMNFSIYFPNELEKMKSLLIKLDKRLSSHEKNLRALKP